MTIRTKPKKKPVRLAPTPQLRPGTYTAEQVLRYVRKVITDEPKRLRMTRWLTMFKGSTTIGVGDYRGARPACGTVACLAGWINTVTRKQCAVVGNGVPYIDDLDDVAALHVLDLYSESEGGLSDAGAALADLFYRTNLRVPGDVPDNLYRVEEIIVNNGPSVFGVFRTDGPRATNGKLLPRQSIGNPSKTRAEAEVFARSLTVQSYYTRGICVY